MRQYETLMRAHQRVPLPSMHVLRNLKSTPPWIIPKRACSEGLWCAAIQRSIQRSVRWVASSNRFASRQTELTTSSSAMITFAPILFCMRIERSGVRSICLPSIGDWKLTPFSFRRPSYTVFQKWEKSELHCIIESGWNLTEMSARSRRLTIWKPPLSVKELRFQSTKVESPPRCWSKLEPGRFSKWYVFPSIIWHPTSEFLGADEIVARSRKMFQKEAFEGEWKWVSKNTRMRSLPPFVWRSDLWQTLIEARLQMNELVESLTLALTHLEFQPAWT